MVNCSQLPSTRLRTAAYLRQQHIDGWCDVIAVKHVIHFCASKYNGRFIQKCILNEHVHVHTCMYMYVCSRYYHELQLIVLVLVIAKQRPSPTVSDVCTYLSRISSTTPILHLHKVFEQQLHSRETPIGADRSQLKSNVMPPHYTWTSTMTIDKRTGRTTR